MYNFFSVTLANKVIIVTFFVTFIFLKYEKYVYTKENKNAYSYISVSFIYF